MSQKEAKFAVQKKRKKKKTNLKSQWKESGCDDHDYKPQKKKKTKKAKQK